MRPKVLHEAAGRALLDRALDVALAVAGDAGDIVVVVGKERFFEGKSDRRRVSARPLPRREGRDPGSAARHRRRGARRGRSRRLRTAKTVVVLSGDVPLLDAVAVKGLVDALQKDKKAAVAVLTATLPNPTGYGRIVRDKKKSFVRIREEKDSSANEKKIAEINTGTYAFDRAFLEKSLPLLTSKNRQSEFYLTDVLSLALKAKRKVVTRLRRSRPPPSA